MQTKPAFLFTILVLSLTMTAYGSERLSFGLKSGLNYGKVRFVDSDKVDVLDISYRRGLLLGGYIQTKLSKNIFLTTEVIYQRFNSNLSLAGNIISKFYEEYKISYLDLAILMKHQTSLPFLPYLIAGPSMDYLLAARYKLDGFPIALEEDISDDFPAVNISAVMGVGKSMRLSKSLSLIVELRVQLWLTGYTISIDESLKRKNQEVQFAFGIGF